MAGDVVDPWLRDIWEGSEVVLHSVSDRNPRRLSLALVGRVCAALLALARVGIDNGRVSPELLAAISATVAAVLAAVSLGLSTAREERKWRRESLVDTVVAFLDASFDAPGELSMGKFRAGAYGKRDEEEHRRAHQRMLRALTGCVSLLRPKSYRRPSRFTHATLHASRCWRCVRRRPKTGSGSGTCATSRARNCWLRRAGPWDLNPVLKSTAS